MKRLVLIASLVVAVGCGKEESGPTEPAPEGASKDAEKKAEKKADKPVAKPVVAGPTEFVAADHKFAVMSLRKPRVSNPPTPGAADKATSYMFSAPGAPGAYMILVATIPLTDKSTDAERKKALTDGRDGLVAKYKATISSDKEFKIGDNHGRDFSFAASHPKMGDMVGRSKIVVRGSELIQVMRVGKPSASALIAEADALIDSFKLTE